MASYDSDAKVFFAYTTENNVRLSDWKLFVPTVTATSTGCGFYFWLPPVTAIANGNLSYVRYKSKEVQTLSPKLDPPFLVHCGDTITSTFPAMMLEFFGGFHPVVPIL